MLNFSRVTSHPRLAAFVAGVLYALAMVLAFPPFNFWPLALVALVPIFWVAGAVGGKPPAIAACVALGVLPFWMYQQFWISRITGAGYPPMCFLLCVFAFAQTYFILKLRNRRELRRIAVPAAVIWCGFNVARGELAFDGYPWYFEGHPLVEYAGEFGTLLGAYGVSLVAVLINAFLADAIRLRDTKSMAAALGCCGLLIGTQWWFQESNVPAGTEKTRIAAIQTNVPQEIKAGGGFEDQLKEWETLQTLTMRAAEVRPALIVWPETMKPGLSLDEKSVNTERLAGLRFSYKDDRGERRQVPSTIFADGLLAMQQKINIPMLIGEEAFDGLHFPETPGGVSVDYDARYNSVFVVEHGAVREERYDKLHLTPFGEYMPYIRSWPWLQKQLLSIGAQGMSFDLREGSRTAPLSVKLEYSSGASQVARECRISTPICFEIADVPTVRKLATNADIIVNLTNDGWFGDSDRTREQHVQLARWRAIECGIPVVRSANTGLSCAIDVHGRFIHAIKDAPAPENRQAGILLIDVPMEHRNTLFMRGGWMLPWFELAGLIGLCVWALFGKARPAATTGPSV